MRNTIGLNNIKVMEAVAIGGELKRIDVETASGVLCEFKNISSYVFSKTFSDQYKAYLFRLKDAGKDITSYKIIFRGSNANNEAKAMLEEMAAIAQRIFPDGPPFNPSTNVVFLGEAERFYP